MSERRRVHVLVSGRVQGVFFRATTDDVAGEHDVDGWVLNREDGRVEAVFEGDPEAVEAMLEFCHEGSDAARVEDLEVHEEDPTGADGFRIRR
jgi:acylphosphatase